MNRVLSSPSRAVLFKVRLHRNGLEGLVQMQILTQWLWSGPETCLSSRLSSDADVHRPQLEYNVGEDTYDSLSFPSPFYSLVRTTDRDWNSAFQTLFYTESKTSPSIGGSLNPSNQQRVFSGASLANCLDGPLRLQLPRNVLSWVSPPSRIHSHVSRRPYRGLQPRGKLPASA